MIYFIINKDATEIWAYYHWIFRLIRSGILIFTHRKLTWFDILYLAIINYKSLISGNFTSTNAYPIDFLTHFDFTIRLYGTYCLLYVNSCYLKHNIAFLAVLRRLTFHYGSTIVELTAVIVCSIRAANFIKWHTSMIDKLLSGLIPGPNNCM